MAAATLARLVLVGGAAAQVLRRLLPGTLRRAGRLLDALRRRRRRSEHDAADDNAAAPTTSTNTQWAGLDSLVSFSSRVIAAARALESERGTSDAYVVDSLAAALAGPDALARARARAAEVAAAATSSSSSPRPVPRLIMRTRFIDDATLAALGAPPPPEARAALAPLLRAVTAAAPAPHARQVALLGSGMDARAWRLPLPRGVAWFEIDRADVLGAKDAALSAAGAQTSTAAAATNRGKYRYPLRSASRATVAADLTLPGWSAELLKAGLDPSTPTVWVAEGLLYYLEPESVPRMLREAAGACAPGSVLVASVLSLGALARMRQRAGVDAKSSSSNNNAAAATATPLTSQFVWGCPDGASARDAYFAAAGWRTVAALPWTDAAEAYGWPVAGNAAGAMASPPPPKELQVTFLVAVRAP